MQQIAGERARGVNGHADAARHHAGKREPLLRRNAASPTLAPSPLPLAAVAFACGIALGWQQASLSSSPRTWLWIALGAWLVAAASFVIGRRSRPANLQTLWRMHPLPVPALLVAMCCLGVGWVSIMQRHVQPNDLAAMLGDDAALVRVRGVALQSPQLKARIGGALAKFDYREPATYFPMRVDALLTSAGEALPVTGQVLVRVDQTVAPFRAGDCVEALGFVLRPAPPRNPGEFDFRAYAQALGQAGILTVRNRDLLMVRQRERHSLISALLDWRDALRQRAGAWLLADLPQTDRTERASLLANILLGQRDEQIDGVYDAFRRVGLAHVLAISGFHLGVLAGFVLMLARCLGGHQRWHGVMVIAFVLLYLSIIDVGMPVLRAAIMTSIASAGLVAGRRWRISGLLWLSAIFLLLWRPDQLFNAGFQLTYALVIALMYLAPIVRQRMFGRPNPESPSTAAMLGQWLMTATAVALTAWLAALPIVLFHFGSISPWAVALSVISVPLAAAILALGFLKMMLAAFLPSIALLLGYPLSLVTDVLVTIVMLIDSLPYSHLQVLPPNAWWAMAALAAVCWWMIGDRRLQRMLVGAGVLSGERVQVQAAGQESEPAHQASRRSRRADHHAMRLLRHALSVCLVAWLLWPGAMDALLRIDMLAVGDGSCYVIRSGERVVVFDAGSSTDLNVARRTLIPAMRRLGVTSIDAIIISHTDADHYSAVIELSRAFDVAQVLVTAHFAQAAEHDPGGPAAFVLDQLSRGRVVLVEAGAGHRMSLEHAELEWLHPPADRAYQRDNDGSMVIRITCGDRRVLLCGDIQQQAMQELLEADPQRLTADVMELPHHGSFHPAALEFVRQVQPQVVMQSTGFSRWQRDRWAEHLQQIERLVTARDGACWIELSHGGQISTGRFVSP